MLDAEPGMTVVGVAATGAAALSLAVEHRPDVAVLDVNMPD
ncbi:DNA-binding response regulator, partial [Nonomuraea sp. K274]|nr:DNA-binding response regulator [Nonomuraea cypriaca]